MNTAINDIAAETRREYYRKWRVENRDKVKKHQDDYWRRQAEKKLAEQEQADGKTSV